MNRRKFINLTALTAPLLSFSKVTESIPAVKPIMISTWEEGKNVNKAAWGILSEKGRAIDAIEAGAIYVEDKISCCVGLGGNPDRDGFVTLDACIMDENANCGVASFGFFAETVLHKCEGLVSVRDDLSEYDDFRLDEADYALVGMKSGRKFRMGDAVKVKVVAANLDKRQLDLHWVQTAATANTKEVTKEKKAKTTTKKKK